MSYNIRVPVYGTVPIVEYLNNIGEILREFSEEDKQSSENVIKTALDSGKRYILNASVPDPLRNPDPYDFGPPDRHPDQLFTSTDQDPYPASDQDPSLFS